MVIHGLLVLGHSALWLCSYSFQDNQTRLSLYAYLLFLIFSFLIPISTQYKFKLKCCVVFTNLTVGAGYIHDSIVQRSMPTKSVLLNDDQLLVKRSLFK